MSWYEVIFGTEIWNHLVMEISFWGHSPENAKERFDYRDGMDETKYADLLNKEIHDKHKKLPDELKIPFLFIDPVCHIFKDPCDSKTRDVTDREKEMFRKYTDR